MKSDFDFSGKHCFVLFISYRSAGRIIAGQNNSASNDIKFSS